MDENDEDFEILEVEFTDEETEETEPTRQTSGNCQSATGSATSTFKFIYSRSGNLRI